MTPLATILALATLATAAPVLLAWDASPSPVNYYEVWLGGVRVAVTDRPELSLDLPTDQCTPLQVVAVGTTGLRSLPANILAQPRRVQESDDLANWTPRGDWYFTPYAPKTFIRLQTAHP